MSPLLLLGIMATGFFAAGLGTMVGLGGGVIVVPVLAVLLGVELKAAIAASAVCVVLNSLRGSAVYLRQGLVNLKLAMILQITTAIFAIIGGLVVVYAPVQALKLVFAVTLGGTIIAMVARPGGAAGVQEGPDPFGVGVSYQKPDGGGRARYIPQHIRSGVGMSGLAGLTSGLLGIGGGAIQVPLMTAWMGVPLRAAVATSTFMVGMTATVSALIYAAAGLVDMAVTVPAMVGIVAGSQVGSRLATRLPVGILKKVLVGALVGLTIAMALDGLGLWSMR